ncbi:hypothetical protein [Desulfobotulus sp.]|jgi:hypothetical protein|uniref:hypothetical protein n=1 Tax=Desulfobotulus sp. TaxID=1940337 RepID=UPI002A365CAE|nr:hypothetical protein [Desulfobotulus sp.]MDY0163068.1 hypothetical protein [Desulfobotulus sp.]
MKTSVTGHLIHTLLLLLLSMAAGTLAWADAGNKVSEAPTFSLQLHAHTQDQPALLTPHWSHADHAMLLGTENPGALQGMDLRMSVDRLHFKSSIQQERSLKDMDPLSGHYNASATEATHMAAGVGYQWNLLNQRLSLIPMMGLSYHGKSIDPKTSVTLSPDQDSIRRETGLSEWNSWWFGLDLRAQPHPDLSVESSLLFHTAKFAEKNPEWGDLSESAIHRSEGEGRIFRLGLRQQLSSSWSAGILYSWQQWMAEKGELSQALPSGDRTRSDIPFNGNIQELNISLSYGF